MIDDRYFKLSMELTLTTPESFMTGNLNLIMSWNSAPHIAFMTGNFNLIESWNSSPHIAFMAGNLNLLGS